MSFRTDLMLAPEQRGILGTVSAWSGGATSTSVATLSGTYTGQATVTITFSANSTQTIGSGSNANAEWNGSDGSGGFLEIGAGYVAGTPILFYEGVYVAASAGTWGASSETCTVTLTAARSLPDDALVFSSDPVTQTSDVLLQEVGRESRDVVHGFVNGDAGAMANTIARVPSLSIDWLDDAQGDRLRYIEGTRRGLMIGENYGADTIFLWRGRSTTPLIGPIGTFTRATAGAYIDKRTGRYRVAASGVPRLQAGKCGEAMLVDAAACTNLLPRFHAKSGTLGWTATGSAVVTFDTGIVPLIDRDDSGFAAAQRKGVLRVNLPVGAHTIHADDAAVAPSTSYTGQVWVRGRGTITVAIRSATAPGAMVVRATSSSLVLTNAWQRLAVTGATVGGNDIADLEIVAVTHNTIVYLGPAQIEAGLEASSIVPTDGASATRNAETLTFPVTPPADHGAMSFWFKWPGDNGSGAYSLVQASGVAGSERFEVRYNAATSNLHFYTDTGTPLTYNIDLAADTWYHALWTWSTGGGTSQILRILYFNGAAVASDSLTFWQPFFGSGLNIAPALAGVSLRGIQFEDFRIDEAAILTLAQAVDYYERFTDDAWLHVHRELAGRAFLIGSMSMRQRATSHPDHYLASLGLSQIRAYDDSVVTVR